ncbi:hypothetical protein KKB83_03310 [Patescibacteria group bacterium]|nr:hypothetical protein [Patescibacteria group bacterium]
MAKKKKRARTRKDQLEILWTELSVHEKERIATRAGCGAPGAVARYPWDQIAGNADLVDRLVRAARFLQFLR